MQHSFFAQFPRLILSAASCANRALIPRDISSGWAGVGVQSGSKSANESRPFHSFSVIPQHSSQVLLNLPQSTQRRSILVQASLLVALYYLFGQFETSLLIALSQRRESGRATRENSVPAKWRRNAWMQIQIPLLSIPGRRSYKFVRSPWRFLGDGVEARAKSTADFL